MNPFSVVVTVSHDLLAPLIGTTQMINVTPASIPNAPFAVLATPLSASQIRITWIDNSVDETGFAVERQLPNGNFTTIGTGPANTPMLTGGGLPASSVFTYRVRAFNIKGDSSFVNLTTAATFATGSPVPTPTPTPAPTPSPTPAPTPSPTATTVPNGPFSLSADSPSPGQVNLIWHDNADNEDGFMVERRSNGGAFSSIATLPANTTTYLDPNLVAASPTITSCLRSIPRAIRRRRTRPRSICSMVSPVAHTNAAAVSNTHAHLGAQCPVRAGGQSVRPG